MDIDHSRDITGLLHAWAKGDARALDSLMPLVYDDLHRAAHSYMAREAPDNTLQTTALVNEVYLRLLGADAVDWQNRAHFLAVCATVMRRILIDFARSRRSLKRGGTATHVPLDDVILVSQTPRVPNASPSGASAIFAIPKSSTFATPRVVMKMLDGLMSR